MQLPTHTTFGLNEDNPALSIVIPAYNEGDNIPHLYGRLKGVLQTINLTWEIIFIDDGSADDSWDKIVHIRNENQAVKGIRLSRNFGHQYALLAGLSHASGDAVITMDADLQHPPELLPSLVHEWGKGYKIVNTIRAKSNNLSFFKKISSDFFYRVFSMLSGIPMEHGMADFRLLDRQVVDSVRSFGEKSLFLRGIVQWVGFPATNITYEASSRFKGTSKYSFRKMVLFSFDAISSFSIIPLRVGILVGIITSALAFGGIFYALFSKFVIKSAVPGWASSMSILSFLIGILFILLGIVGEYIGRILIEVKQRPRFLIREVAGVETQNRNL